jgi:hypothetical protein
MPEWIVNNWYPKGGDIVITSPEGSCKTIFGTQLCVCHAAGMPFLGQATTQGRVLIIDEETPEFSLDNWLQRFALGAGVKNWRELPIERIIKTGFRIGRRDELERVMDIVKRFKPNLVRLESVLAMLPEGREAIEENDSRIGTELRRVTDAIRIYADMTLISAHAKKPTLQWSLSQLKQAEMPSIVRGHGSIIGIACDTGLVLKKISEPIDADLSTPLRFVVLTKARRCANAFPDVYVELKEESYGKGWARLERIEPIAIPPSELVCSLANMFIENQDKEFTQRMIRERLALRPSKEVWEALNELCARGIARNSSKSFTYQLNPNLAEDDKYLIILKDIIAKREK